MPTLYQRVIENPALARAHSEEQRQGRVDEFDTAIGDLRKKYAAALKTDEKGNTIETPASLQTKYALTQALQARDAFQNPLKKPGIGQKIEEALRLKKKPQEQAVTTQTGGVEAPVATAPLPPSPAEPASRQVNLQPAASAAGAAALPKNRFANPEDQPTNVSFSFNKQFAKPGPYVTKLSPQQERQFQAWAKQHPDLVEGELNTATPDYDVRGRWLAEQKGDPDAKLVKSDFDGKMHASDKWKTPYNATFSNESIYAKPNAPRWQGDKLVAADGTLLVDETAKPATGVAVPRLSTGAVEPGRPATTLPGLPTPATPVLPSRTLTVKRPAYTPKQIREMAQKNQQAQEETELLTAGAPAAAENQYTAKRNELIQGGFSKEDADKAVRIMAGLEAKPAAEKPVSGKWLQVPGKLNGKQVTFLYDEKEGKYKAQNGDDLSDEDLAAFVPDPKQAKPSTAWKNEYAAAYARGHGITPEQLTPADMNFIDQQIALSSSAPSTTITNTLKQDADGFWRPIQESNRRIPGFGVILGDPRGRMARPSKVPTRDPETAAAPTAAELPPATVGGAAPTAPAPVPAIVPTTAGAAKKLAAKRFNRPATPATAPAAVAPGAPKAPRTVGGGGRRGFGGVSVGPELFAAPSKDYTAAKADLEGARDRANTMDRNLQSAMKGDQQAMISLVSNHIGMTLGGQKGARINQAVWNEAVESVPYISRIAAKWDSNGYLSGVTLAPEQMRQMVGLAHEKVAVLQDHVARLQQQLRLAPQTSGPQADKNSLANRLDRALEGK